jgi:ADP-ribose pyrophosphatase YjhB (NUDIX family)
MEKAVLGFLIRKNKRSKELLLAIKKKGFGSGKWNGVGGRFVPSKDKNLFKAISREVREEIGVKVLGIKRVAVLNFYHPYLRNKREKSWQVHAFLIRDWEGGPKESKEIKPKWLKVSKIPFNRMWLDRKFWLPRILKGEKIKAKFWYKNDEVITSYRVSRYKSKAS